MIRRDSAGRLGGEAPSAPESIQKLIRRNREERHELLAQHRAVEDRHGVGEAAMAGAAAVTVEATRSK